MGDDGWDWGDNPSPETSDPVPSTLSDNDPWASSSPGNIQGGTTQPQVQQPDPQQELWGTPSQGYQAQPAQGYPTQEYQSQSTQAQGYSAQSVVENIPGDSWNSFSQEPQYEAPIDQPIPKVPAFNFSPKVAGIIVGGLLLFLGLLFLVLNSIKVTPKQNVPQQPPAQTQGQQAQPSQPSNTTDVRLIFVPDSTPLDYSGEVFQTTGRVAAKLKYAVNNQVIYCLQISIAAGSSNETVNFFCNYATFTSVAKDELVMVKFQQVEDGFISVNEVTK